MRILLIERDPEKSVRGLLGSEYDVWTTGTVEEACRVIGSDDYDAVLLDLGLTNGGLCRAVQQLRKADQSAPLVALTDLRDPTGGANAVAAGAHEYVEKEGLDAHLLVTKISQAVERSNKIANDLVRDLKLIRQNVSAADRSLAEAEAAIPPVLPLASQSGTR